MLTAAIQGRLTAEQAGRLQEEFFEDPACKTLFSIMKSDLSSRSTLLILRRSATHLKGEAELTLLSELSLSEDLDDRALQRIDENLQPDGASVPDRRECSRSSEKSTKPRRAMASVSTSSIRRSSQLSRMLNSLK